jgi:hypothetical protein
MGLVHAVLEIGPGDVHEEGLLTLDETARALRISRRTATTRIGRDELPYIRRGGPRIRVPASWLAAWLRGCELERIEVADGVVVRPVEGQGDDP